MKQISSLLEKKKKLLLILPLLVFPFATMALWALGLVGQVQPPKNNDQPGLNKQVPAAQLATGNMPDKMSLYDMAARDSGLLHRQLNFDSKFTTDTTLSANSYPLFTDSSLALYQSSGSGLQSNENPSETRLKNKLAELEKSLNQPPSVAGIAYQRNSYADSELTQLRNIMPSAASATPDPELQQLSELLEKITDIQHPQKVQERLKEQSLKNRGRVYAVKVEDTPVSTTILHTQTNDIGTLQSLAPGFYDLEETQVSSDTLQPAGISAAVSETQTLVNGSTVKMRLDQNVFVNGVGVPSGTFISGICAIEGERLKITISAIRYDNNIIPVNLSVYDLDGIEGVRIPGAISRDAAKEGADRALQSVQLLSVDPSMGAQAASAGVEAAKSLFSKKAKLVRVTVKAGHPVILVDMKAKQNTY